MMMNSFLFKLSWLVLFWVISCAFYSQATDFNILRPGQQLRDFDSLVSPNKVYSFSFFNPDSSFSLIRYLGIEFMRSFNTKYVWIANRQDFLSDSSGILNITQEGNMILTDSNGVNITINTVKPPSDSNNISVTISDSGNLVLKAGEQIVWQSFDHPTDTFLPGMKVGLFGKQSEQPQRRFLTSWLSPAVATPGAFTLGIDPDNPKQLVIWQRGVIYWRSGIWDGKRFRYVPPEIQFSYFSSENESHFTFLGVKTDFPEKIASSCVQLSSSAEIGVNRAVTDSAIETPYSLSCNDKSEYFSTGCTAPEPSHCRGGDEFATLRAASYFGEWRNPFNYSIGLSDCQEMCRKNCSCLAYATLQTDGRGCQFFQAKTSILLRRLNEGQVNGTQVYVRNSILHGKGIGRSMQLGLGIGGSVAFLTVSLCCYLLWRKYCGKSNEDDADEVLMSELGIAAADEHHDQHKPDSSRKKNHELPLFSFSTIKTATKNFSRENFLGRGGFGPVYKGTLDDGVEIAVKRLSQRSRQGLKEFKTEVILISKLQHRNLVRLLGCCIHGKERILIYEYLPNKSLDAFLFDATKRQLLDWKIRLCIIEGIAQGLLYLHKYSRLKIIHRDLKASNILLDASMNPKISDFGTARIFGENEFEANTNRIVGTYGYMSPEYAMDGLFSEKSDVFSYGVMLLEIISGKKNIGFYHSDRFMNLLGYAWELWNEGQGLELVDPILKETYPPNEALRCVQIGLLCVQESAADRPTMSVVVSMLSNESMTLLTPKQPAFCNVSGTHDADKPEDPKPLTRNQLTISDVEPR